MTVYSLDVHLFLLGTSLLFHVQFYLLFLDLHTYFSRGRSGGLVFPSLEEFSTVCGDPCSQMEKAMAPHSSTLAWKIPWMEEPGRLQSMGSLRVGHNFTFTFTFHFHALEKAMASHSSVLAWRIPGMGEPSGLPSMGSHRFRHD